MKQRKELQRLLKPLSVPNDVRRASPLSHGSAGINMGAKCPLCCRRMAIGSDVIYETAEELANHVDNNHTNGRGWVDALMRFESRYMPIPESGCLAWMGTTTSDDYGVITVKGKKIMAHRWSYEHFKGPIPKGLVIDHKCRVHCCVNPEHLEPVTIGENTLRGIGMGAINRKKQFCSKGHPFSGDNLVLFKKITASGKVVKRRRCRMCIRALQISYSTPYMREYKRRKKNARASA